MVQITAVNCSSLAIIHMHVAKNRALGQCNLIKNKFPEITIRMYIRCILSVKPSTFYETVFDFIIFNTFNFINKLKLINIFSAR